jgi:hypothetical protein
LAADGFWREAACKKFPIQKLLIQKFLIQKFLIDVCRAATEWTIVVRELGMPSE